MFTEGTGFHNSSCGSGAKILDDIELSVQMKFNESAGKLLCLASLYILYKNAILFDDGIH